MPTSPRPPSSAIKYVSFATPKDPSSDVIDVSSVTTEFNTLFETVVEVAEQVDPIKLNQTLTATAEALDGLGERFDDNPNLNRVLEQLRTISGVLSERRMDLSDTLTSLSKFIVSLGEALASGPYFKVMLANLAPYWLLQPYVDAAFKKRGIDPEEFWGNAGLPAFRFPDPNGTGFSNGAPPPAPTPLEGTPANPGPAVVPGSPCSYTPGPGGDPTPGNPLPCADLTVGPFGDNPYGPNYAGQGPNVATSAPNAHGPQPSPGVPASAIPGQLAPTVPGQRVPLPPAPPGARTVPLEPQPSAPDFTPGIAPLPPALDGPPPPPGPGLTLPPAGEPPLPGNPPFLPPGSQG